MSRHDPPPSVALFAPGWTFETHGKKDRRKYDVVEAKYWRGRDAVALFDERGGWEFATDKGGQGWQRLDRRESYNGSCDRKRVWKGRSVSLREDLAVRSRSKKKTKKIK